MYKLNGIGSLYFEVCYWFRVLINNYMYVKIKYIYLICYF